MNQKDFNTILQQPQLVTKDHIDGLKSIIDQFPYLQSARAIYLKALKNADSFKYNHTLKTTAAYTTDRSILFNFITSESFDQNEISKLIQQNTSNINNIKVTAQDISISKSVKVDSDLKNHIESAKNTLDPNFFEIKSTTEAEIISNQNNDITEQSIEVAKSSKNISAEETLKIGKPLNFDNTETHSFNEWLSLTSLTPIQREKDKQEINKKSEKALKREAKFKLINQFITKNPKIDPHKKSTPKHNIAKAQMIQPEALMTETLARIYMEQKNYSKAIQSYKILSLKYPEKSGFFADQIKAVKQLQEKNKE